MKYFLLYILPLLFSLNCYAQNFELRLTGISTQENKTIDSLSYTSIHKNLKSLRQEIETTADKLSKLGYIEIKVINQRQVNDSIYSTQFNLGLKIKSIHLYVGTDETIVKLLSPAAANDSIFLPYIEIESFLQNSTSQLERKGYALASLKMTNFQKKGSTLIADLEFESETPRKLNAIVVKYPSNQENTKFPAGHMKQINRKYQNKVFNNDVVNGIQNDFEKFGFVQQIKSPEILFTKDSTKVFVYLQKNNANTFDGFIGFNNNNDNKRIAFNGYLDLTLQNTLHVGEQFSLYWKSDGNQQKTFKAGIEIPYLFKSPIGLKAQINIFKQDSTFQNTKTAIDLGYLIDYNTRIYLGYQSTQSSDIQNTNSGTISDYNNSFLASSIEYFKLDEINPIYLKKTNLSFTTGIGSRTRDRLTETSGNDKQFYININASHNFYLNRKNTIHVKTQDYYLHSNNYVVNELYRFGGINSIRGFAENSLQAHFLVSLLTEYRYLLSSKLYVHTILDYGHFQDKTSSINHNKNILGIGLGMGLQTKTGLMKLAFANGSEKDQKINTNNSIFQISYSVKF